MPTVPVHTDDCRELWRSLAGRYGFESRTTDPVVVRRLDEPTGFTASFLVQPAELVQPLAFVFFPGADDWRPAAYETFAFEAACWRRWCAKARPTIDASPFQRHLPPLTWFGLDRLVDGQGKPLIGCHEARLDEAGDEGLFPVLVRPYLPWAPAESGPLSDPLRGSLERVVKEIVDEKDRRRLPTAFTEVSARHVLVYSSSTATERAEHRHEVVPTRWRTFHKRFSGFGLSREERSRRFVAEQPPPASPPRPVGLRPMLTKLAEKTADRLRR